MKKCAIYMWYTIRNNYNDTNNYNNNSTGP